MVFRKKRQFYELIVSHFCTISSIYAIVKYVVSETVIKRKLKVQTVRFAVYVYIFLHRQFRLLFERPAQYLSAVYHLRCH